MANPSDTLDTAMQLYQQQHYDEAKRLCRQVLQQQPDQIEALLLMGIMACQLAQFEEAIACFRRVLKLKPKDTNTLNNLGNVFRAQRQYKEAIAHYNQALAINPYHVDAHYNLGIALQEMGEDQAAIDCYQHAIALDAKYLNAYLNLGAILCKQGSPHDAIVVYEQALAIAPDFAEGYDQLGVALREIGSLEEAIYCHQRAIALTPTALAHYNLGNALLDQGNCEAAIAAYDRAIALNPPFYEARLAKATSYLLAGDLRSGFNDYEARWGDNRENPYNSSLPLWDGSPLKGQRILLIPEQGLSSTIQFVRYTAMLTHLGGEVIVSCPDPLLRLFSTIPSIRHLVPQTAPLPQFDVYLPMMSLPRLLKTRLDSIPAAVPYLYPPAQSPVTLPRRGNELAVGIIWNAPDSFASPFPARRRSCPLIALQRLLTLPNTRFYSLQQGEALQELTSLGWHSQIQDLSDSMNDFADIAAIAHQLDLIITVDTAVAHLAGAMAKPVWVMLPYAPDWRWLRDRPDSPWYPTLRLFRQRYPGDWAGVIEQIAAALLEEMG